MAMHPHNLDISCTY